MSTCVGVLVRQRRWMMGLRRAEAAEQIGIEPEQLESYESGAKPIEPHLLAAIATVLSVPLSYFDQEDRLEGSIPSEAIVLSRAEVARLIRTGWKSVPAQSGPLADLIALLSSDRTVLAPAVSESAA